MNDKKAKPIKRSSKSKPLERGGRSKNPFSIGTGSTNKKTSNLGKSVLENTVKVKVTGDNRKAVRMPIEIYERLMSDEGWGAKKQLLSVVLLEFQKAYNDKGTAVMTESGLVETKPLKVSNEDFKVLKMIKFETDMSYTDIMYSAISYYLKNKK